MNKELIDKENVNAENGEYHNSVTANEEQNEQEEAQRLQEDLSSYSKDELLRLLENSKISDDNTAQLNALLKDIKANYDNITEAERAEALDKFVQDGGEENDFEFRKDATSQKFDKVYDDIKDRIKQRQSAQEKEKDKNLTIKNELLSRLRELISKEETDESIKALKEIQEEWRKTGSVPGAQASELWQNYNALVERFYNNRSIYFELKELDRKKNLDLKKELCEKAEALVEMPSLPQAIKELKKLHEEFRNIGPVPKEDQEELWNRFKAASDKLYERRGAYHENLKKEQDENYLKKQALAEKIHAYIEFNSDRIDDWKKKSQEILVIQEEWKSIGPVAHEHAKELSKKFWPACKTFFHHKDKFFKTLEEQKGDNLKKKIELCEKAEAIKDSEDFTATANQLKQLQKEWEETGPVPAKQKDEIFKRFKAACDTFFKRKRERQADAEKQYEENLKKKIELCESIEKLAATKNSDAEAIKALQHDWKSLGFVPKAEMKNIQTRYNQAIDNYLNSLSEGEKDVAKLSVQLNILKDNPKAAQQLQRKEGDIKKRITALKHDIDAWTTNMGFLGRSKGAEQLKKETEAKINQAQEELKGLEKQLKAMRG